MKQKQQFKNHPFYIDVIRLFLHMFKTYRKEIHPIPSWRQREAIKEAIETGMFLDAIEDLSEWRILFDQYFQTDFGPACDYHISHCFSGKILENRYFEVLY